MDEFDENDFIADCENALRRMEFSRAKSKCIWCETRNKLLKQIGIQNEHIAELTFKLQKLLEA